VLLILEIAAGVILALLVLTYWPVILAGLAVLAVVGFFAILAATKPQQPLMTPENAAEIDDYSQIGNDNVHYWCMRHHCGNQSREYEENWCGGLDWASITNFAAETSYWGRWLHQRDPDEFSRNHSKPAHTITHPSNAP
jgi:hypothetical protein